MGFLSLFSKKSSSNRLNKSFGRGVRAQAYETKVASQAPLRGAYPVAGNGANVLDTLSRSARFRQTEIFVSTTSEAAAPAPTVPLVRDPNASRPSTAPNEVHPTSPWASKHRDSPRGPPLSFRKPRIQLPLTSGDEAPKSARYGAGFTQGFPRLQKWSSHMRNLSLFSDGGKSVDVLDAHSEISGLDFRSRVQASGVREYGEDVADRNLAKNAFDLDSSLVRAFYFTAPGGNKLPPNRDIPRTVLGRTRAQGEASRLDEPSHFEASPETKDTGGPLLHSETVACPATIEEKDSGVRTTVASREDDRKPGPRTYVPKGSNSGFTSNTSAKMRPLSSHRPMLSGDARRLSTAAYSVHARPATSWDPGRGDDEPAVPHYVPRRLGDGLEKKSRLPVAVPKLDMSTDQFRFPPATHQPTSSSRPGSSNPAADLSPALRLTRARRSSSLGKYTRHALQLSVSSTASGDLGGATGLDSRPSHCAEPLHTRSNSRDSPERRRRGDGYSRSRSTILPRRGQLEEIYEHVPERANSLRDWSLTSAARSVSSLSSNPLGNRPHSRHTANTSVDLSSSATNALSSISAPSSGRRSMYSTEPDGKLKLVADDAPPTPDTAATEYFTIDDCASSDDDSFTGSPLLRRGVCEEHLIFRETGYGIAELPGLHDFLDDPAPAPPTILRLPPQSHPRPATSTGLPHRPPQQSRRSSPIRGHRSIPSFPSVHKTPSRGRSRRRRQSSAAETTASSDQQDPWRQQSPTTSAVAGSNSRPRSRRLASSSSNRGRKGSSRLSALGTASLQSGGGMDDDLAPAPVVPMSPRSIRSTTAMMTTDAASTAAIGPRFLLSGQGLDYNKGICDNVIEEEKLAKVDVAAAVRFRKFDKARRRTLEMALQRGGRVAAAASPTRRWADKEHRRSLFVPDGR